MDDLISRQAAIDALEREKTYCRAFREGYAPVDIFEKYNAGLTDGIKAISNLPSAQSEIIRCKNCKYCEHWYADKGRCFLWHEGGIDVFEDGFCNYAERRTDG